MEGQDGVLRHDAPSVEFEAQPQVPGVVGPVGAEVGEVNEIVVALMAADVSFRQVVQLKKAIQTALAIEDAAGVNRRKLIKQTVFNELKI